MQEITPLEPGKFYHIYNRGINGENLFKEERNYDFFLEKYAKYISPVVDTYAYCLLKNHFHILVRIKDFEDSKENLKDVMETQKWEQYPNVSKQFSHFFNSYAQSINATNNRTGGLFETSFKRKVIDNNSYFSRLILYIHANPQKHSFIKDYRDYPYSSYWSHLSKKNTKLKRQEVLDWFGNEHEYVKFHNSTDFTDMKDDFIIEFD